MDEIYRKYVAFMNDLFNGLPKDDDVPKVKSLEEFTTWWLQLDVLTRDRLLTDYCRGYQKTLSEYTEQIHKYLEKKMKQ